MSRTLHQRRTDRLIRHSLNGKLAQRAESLLSRTYHKPHGPSDAVPCLIEAMKALMLEIEE